MSYRIVYGPEIKPKSTYGKSKRVRMAVTAAVLAAIVILSFAFFGDTLSQLLLPGDAEVTGAALQGMVQDLKNGESFSDAVTAFCRVIVDNAEIAH